MFLLAGRCWHALTNGASEGKFQLNKADRKELYVNLSTRPLEFMRPLACYVLNEMLIELRYEQTDAATPSLLAQKCWALLRLFCFKLCATTHNNMQQHATGRANGRNMYTQQRWELVANNVASVCTGL